jgi:chemotaxis methyl-accepting protein methylase
MTSPPPLPVTSTPATGIDDEAFARLLTKIGRDRHFACASYKEKCLRRRIAVRLRARGVASYDDYAALLDADVQEYEKLLDALTINVTKLFRNWETYAALERLVVPELWARTALRINVWSAGCASGEEAYSLAVLFHRHAVASGQPMSPQRLRVLGTDIDRESLAAAERGAYGESAFADTPAHIRSAYFGPTYPAAVDSAVRSTVHFERRDLIREPAPTGQHLIACRNVIIYFDRVAQEQLFARLHDALVPDGFLVLGKVESLLGESRQLFRPIDARERIFQRI